MLVPALSAFGASAGRVLSSLGRFRARYSYGDDPALRRRRRQLALCHDLDRQVQPGRAIAFAQ
jgi:hypothetical protein